MCRLFALTAGSGPLRATFWLIEAPDSLAVQSRRNPDGYGIATFTPGGSAVIDKRPDEADLDQNFAREARELESTMFVAHVRYASTGAHTLQNTHPFEQHGRVFAHNGYLGDLPALESRLGDHMELVKGDTDSERFFALITREIAARDGDIAAGITAAARWAAAQLPIFSINCVLATARELWALRYPESHGLMMLKRASGGPSGVRPLDAASSHGTVRVRSGALHSRAAVLIASERMDEDPGWRMLEPGELVHVDRELGVSSTIAVPEAPAHLVSLAELEPQAAASQQF